jgi:hypothetical protein
MPNDWDRNNPLVHVPPKNLFETAVQSDLVLLDDFLPQWDVRERHEVLCPYTPVER